LRFSATDLHPPNSVALAAAQLSDATVLFDHCAQCRQCCHIEPGFPPLEITLTATEKKAMGSMCIQTQCTHLGAQGCTLDDSKPLSCKLYPLAYQPKQKKFYYDSDCPLMPEYQRQLSNPHSEASAHLASMKSAIQALHASDAAFLRENYRIDSDYFDLQPLKAKA
jgi:Fe-S-cluster containining protein